MKLRDLLGKLGIKDFNIVKYEKNVEREVTVKNKVVLKNVQVSINLPAVRADDRMIYHAEQLLTPGIGFVREDLVYAEAMMLVQRKEQHAILQELRGCIEPEHFRALIVSYAIINYEDLGDWELAQPMLDDLVEVYGEDGRRLYNRARSGYVEGYFVNELRTMKFESGKGQGYKDRFREFFTEKLRFFDLAVWSNDSMTSGVVTDELRKRIKGLGVPAVKVYGRGEANVEKVKLGCAAYLVEDNGAMLENEEHYRICHSPCCSLTITKRPEPPRPPRTRWKHRRA